MRISAIDPLHHPVTWYKVTHALTQVAPLSIQKKGRSRWNGPNCFVLEVPLCDLRHRKLDFVPCDRIVHSAYPFLVDVPENAEDPVLPINHCRLRSLGGHFYGVENSEAFVCRQNRIPIDASLL